MNNFPRKPPVLSGQLWILTSDTVLLTMTLADPEGQEGGAAVQEKERLRPGGGRARA